MPRAAPAHVSSSANRRPDIRSVTKANAMMGQVTYTPRLLSSASRGNLEKARKKPGTNQIAQHFSGTYVIPKPINEMHRGLFCADRLTDLAAEMILLSWLVQATEGY